MTPHLIVAGKNIETFQSFNLKPVVLSVSMLVREFYPDR